MGCLSDGIPTNCNRVLRAINNGEAGRLIIDGRQNPNVAIANMGWFLVTVARPQGSEPPAGRPHLIPGRPNPKPGNRDPYNLVDEGIEWRFALVGFHLDPQNPTYSSGGQLSPCLRDALRQFFPAMKVHGRSYSPVDDARFKSGIPSVLNIAQDNNAVTLGLYDIRFNPAQVNLNGGNFDSLDTIVEEVAHTVQFLQTWAKRPQAIYIGHDLGGYDAAQASWAADYAYYSSKGRLQNGDAYKNDVEKWAKNRKFDILTSLLSDKKLVQQGNVCGYDLTNNSLARPDW
jgi:hypothetical protein